MRVRADRPSYWIGETFDDWDGANWSVRHSAAQLAAAATTSSPFILPGARRRRPGARPDRPADLLRRAVVAQPRVPRRHRPRGVVPDPRPLHRPIDDAIVSPIGLGPGAIYTVESYVNTPTPGAAARRAAASSRRPGRASWRPTLELPHPYPRVAGAGPAGDRRAHRTPTTRSQSLIAWIGAHTRYSTDIPPLAPGQDTVDEFLFGNRTGFCEQISTVAGRDAALHRHPGPRGGGVRARALQPHHRPLRRRGQRRPRLGAGVVPGLRLAELRPHRRGARWPTRRRARPCCTTSPARWRRLPWVPIGARPGRCRGGGAGRRCGVAAGPATWAEKAARDASSAAGRRAGRRAAPDETLTEYAARHRRRWRGDRSGTLAGAGGGGRGAAPTEGRHPAPRTTRQHPGVDARPAQRASRAGVLAGAGPVRRGAAPARRRSSPPPRAGGGTPSADGDG